MTELTFSILKYGFLALLWLFVWLAVRSMHKDVLDLSPRTSKKHRKRERLARQAAQAPTPTPVRVNAGRTSASQAVGALGAGAAGAIGMAGMAGMTPQMQSGAGNTTGLRANELPTLLVVIDGPLAGTTVPLQGEQLTLGRAPSNTVVLDDEFVSSHHARIYFDEQSHQWAIEDLHSTNGTMVGGDALRGAMILPARLPVRIGATTLELR